MTTLLDLERDDTELLILKGFLGAKLRIFFLLEVVIIEPLI